MNHFNECTTQNYHYKSEETFISLSLLNFRGKLGLAESNSYSRQ